MLLLLFGVGDTTQIREPDRCHHHGVAEQPREVQLCQGSHVRQCGARGISAFPLRCLWILTPGLHRPVCKVSVGLPETGRR